MFFFPFVLPACSIRLLFVLRQPHYGHLRGWKPLCRYKTMAPRMHHVFSIQTLNLLPVPAQFHNTNNPLQWTPSLLSSQPFPPPSPPPRPTLLETKRLTVAARARLTLALLLKVGSSLLRWHFKGYAHLWRSPSPNADALLTIRCSGANRLRAPSNFQSQELQRERMRTPWLWGFGGAIIQTRSLEECIIYLVVPLFFKRIK